MSTARLNKTLGCPMVNGVLKLKKEEILKLSEEERSALFHVCLDRIEKAAEHRASQGGSALYEHELINADANTHYYNGSTIKKVLDAVYAKYAYIKGQLIALANSVHSGSHGPIELGMDFAKHLHHGTSRMYDANGHINEENWQALVDYVRKMQPNETDIIRRSTFETFIDRLNAEKGFESDNGRKETNKLDVGFQNQMGYQSRSQMFEILHCGYKPDIIDPRQKDYCMKMEDLEKFFRLMPAALLKATFAYLPIDQRIPDPAPDVRLVINEAPEARQQLSV